MNQDQNQNQGLLLAITTAGSLSKLGRLIGVRKQSIAKWRQIPAHQIIPIERATGIPREKLRPDLYRREEAAG